MADLSAPATGVCGQPVSLSVLVTNIGPRQGTEVVQVYVAPRNPRLPRPPKEMKAFAKIGLEAGESRMISLTLEPRAFAPYDPATASWPVDPGEYDILVGHSAEDIRLSATITLGYLPSTE